MFKDGANRTWMLSINLASIKAVRAILNIDLMDANDGKVFKSLSDPCTMADVLFVLCKQDADKLSITDTDFGSALSGDVFENACNAFWDEWVEFFPLSKRQLLTKFLNKMKEYQNEKLAEVTEAIEKLELPSSTKNIQVA